MRALLAVFVVWSVNAIALADDGAPPAPLMDDAADVEAEISVDAPSTSSEPVPREADAEAPSSNVAPATTGGSSVPTWLYTVPLGCVTFAAVWWVASAVLAPLNAVAGLGGIAALVLAAVSSSYAQVAVGDYFGDRRGAVLPSAIASACGTLGCMVPGLVAVLGAFVVGYIGTFAALIATLQSGNVDPRVVVASLSAVGAIGVGLFVVGVLGSVFLSIPVGQVASAVAYAFFAEPLDEGEASSFEIPGFLTPSHQPPPRRAREEDLRDDDARDDDARGGGRVLAPAHAAPRAAMAY